MTRWRESVLGILLASFPGVVSAQVDCDTVPHGPARTDCYVGLSRVYRGQSDVAAGNAHVQSDAARLQQVTGTRNHSKASKHRRKKLPQLAQNDVADRSGQGSSAAPSGRGKIWPGHKNSSDGGALKFAERKLVFDACLAVVGQTLR